MPFYLTCKIIMVSIPVVMTFMVSVSMLMTVMMSVPVLMAFMVSISVKFYRFIDPLPQFLHSLTGLFLSNLT